VQISPFSFLQKAESENLLTFIQDEHPQTIALILRIFRRRSKRNPRRLPSQKQIEVVKRVANMEQTNPEVIKEVERGLEHRLSDIVSQTFEKAAAWTPSRKFSISPTVPRRRGSWKASKPRTRTSSSRFAG